MTDPPSWQGFLAAGVAIILYGFYCLPAKKFSTGDGMFFQWVFCSSVMYVGMTVNILRGFPKFYPEAMLGGFCFTTGNLTVVPIIKTIGLGTGFLLWSVVNLLTGWATARFGLFLNAEIPNHEVMNYIGVAMALISIVFYVFVKSELNIDQNLLQYEILEDSPVNNTSHKESPGEENTQVQNAESFLESFSPLHRRIIGFCLAIVAGLLYGFTFTPVIWTKEKLKGASDNDLDYVFAHFCGVFTSSSIYMLIYCAYMRNNPKVYPQVIIPGTVAGILWGAATTGWFLANKILSQAITFPIIGTGPGIITAAISVFYFKEIKGVRNYVLLLAAISFGVTGSVLTGLSK